MKAYIKPAIEIVVTKAEQMICLSGGDSQGTVVADAPERNDFDEFTDVIDIF